MPSLDWIGKKATIRKLPDLRLAKCLDTLLELLADPSSGRSPKGHWRAFRAGNKADQP